VTRLLPRLSFQFDSGIHKLDDSIILKDINFAELVFLNSRPRISNSKVESFKNTLRCTQCLPLNVRKNRIFSLNQRPSTLTPIRPYTSVRKLTPGVPYALQALAAGRHPPPHPWRCLLPHTVALGVETPHPFGHVVFHPLHFFVNPRNVALTLIVRVVQEFA